MRLEEANEQQYDHNSNKKLNTNTDYINCLPLCFRKDFDKQCNALYVGVRFPMTHFCMVDPQLSSLIGYSIFRMFAQPVRQFDVNNRESETILSTLRSTATSKPSVAIILYRSCTCDVIVVHWEITMKEVNRGFYAVGVDVTQEIEASKAKQATNIQKILRQWLHSIRNASFEQQARLILDEVNDLEQKLHTTSFESEFKSIKESLTMLIHTTKTSVGLIDQALDSNGMMHQMSVLDFANNFAAFPHNFAQAEGLGMIYCDNRFLLNGGDVEPSAYSDLYVKGDILSIQSVLDNILSNAVRYVV
jgi:signal transduction histidine kinase